MIEKMEQCPDCNKALDQVEYDGQFCADCHTTSFGFQAPKTLAGMVGYVKARKRIYDDATAGFSLDAEGYKLWRAARDEAVGLARNALESVGAKTKDEWNGASISLEGIRSTSTSGFANAMTNWLTAARKKLERNAA